MSGKMSGKMSVKEFYEWIDKHQDLLEAIDNNIINYDDYLNAEDKLETSLGREIGKVELEKILDDFLNKELDIKYDKVNDDMPLYNVYYEGDICGNPRTYEGTTNNIEMWIANHNMNRLHEGEMFEWEDDFDFEEIDVSIYKESEDE